MSIVFHEFIEDVWVLRQNDSIGLHVATDFANSCRFSIILGGSAVFDLSKYSGTGLAQPVSPEPLRFTRPTPAPATETESESDAMLAKMAEEEPDFAAALKKLKERELEEARTYWAMENKDECLMCSG
ncbi:hypothetical protein B0H11DRAFT_2285089 [Mycena galericulata]|nr:hypothetical protein B0H11DRAFT_2285089 [Mycena galericulata]